MKCRQMEVSTSSLAYELLRKRINPYQEEVWIVGLSPALNVVCQEMVFRGTVDHSSFHPRDVFRHLILSNSFCFILAHNHPSGALKPSRNDIVLTKRMIRLSNLLGIKLIDHLIVSEADYLSLFSTHHF